MTLTLTIPAAKEIRQILQKQELEAESTYLRISVQGEGTNRKYHLDLTGRLEPDDQRFTSHEVQLICSSEQAEALDGATIDFREQEGVGSGFAVDVPEKKKVTRLDGDASEAPPTRDKVLAALHQVNDPEVGVNVVDLGLVYGLEVDERDVRITMTLTTPACPLEGVIRREVDDRIAAMCPGTTSVEVKIVWEPRWTPQQMTDEGRRQLGWSR